MISFPSAFRRMLASSAIACLAVSLPMNAAMAASGDARDFEGTWMLSGADLFLGIDLPYNPTGQNLTGDRLRLVKEGHGMANPHLTCRPTGVAGFVASKSPLLILQPAKQMIVVTQEDREVRFIDLDRDHPANLKPTYSGDAVAHWEGDTLVVDTVGYNGKGQLDEVANPQSDQSHVIERWTKSPDGNTLSVEMTVDDPVYYTKPFKIQRNFKHVPGARIGDYDCSENPRSDDYDNLTFTDMSMKPNCVRQVKNGIAADKVVCTPVEDKRKN